MGFMGLITPSIQGAIQATCTTVIILRWLLMIKDSFTSLIMRSKHDDLRYSTGAPNGPWTTTVVDSQGTTGRNPAIAVDAADRPHIVYHSCGSFDLKYATLNPVHGQLAGKWRKHGRIGDSSSIFIDDSGIIHIAYSDDTNNVTWSTCRNPQG